MVTLVENKIRLVGIESVVAVACFDIPELIHHVGGFVFERFLSVSGEFVVR